MDKSKISKSGRYKGIRWNLQSTFGTKFYRFTVLESMIKSKKKAMKAVVGNEDVNNKELITMKWIIFNKVESLMILNSQSSSGQQ